MGQQGSVTFIAQHDSNSYLYYYTKKDNNEALLSSQRSLADQKTRKNCPKKHIITHDRLLILANKASLSIFDSIYC